MSSNKRHDPGAQGTMNLELKIVSSQVCPLLFVLLFSAHEVELGISLVKNNLVTRIWSAICREKGMRNRDRKPTLQFWFPSDDEIGIIWWTVSDKSYYAFFCEPVKSFYFTDHEWSNPDDPIGMLYDQCEQGVFLSEMVQPSRKPFVCGMNVVWTASLPQRARFIS